MMYRSGVHVQTLRIRCMFWTQLQLTFGIVCFLHPNFSVWVKSPPRRARDADLHHISLCAASYKLPPPPSCRPAVPGRGLPLRQDLDIWIRWEDQITIPDNLGAIPDNGARRCIVQYIDGDSQSSVDGEMSSYLPRAGTDSGTSHVDRIVRHRARDGSKLRSGSLGGVRGDCPRLRVLRVVTTRA
jgi:hypothetical protein